MIEKKLLKSRSEWLKNRSRIGGSDAAAVIGLNPYKTNVELWREKTGQAAPPDISDKPYVIYGTQAEKYLRELFALDFPQYKVKYEENNMFLNSKYPFAHASLDGWLTDDRGRHGVLEIKTTNILQSMQKEKWADRIPDNYYIQILHNMFVCDFDFAVLKAQLRFDYSGDIVFKTKHYFIERADVASDIEYLIDSERKFWSKVESMTEPDLILPDF